MAEVWQKRSNTDQEAGCYLTDFDWFNKSLAASAPLWLHQIRKEALGCFSKLGFPAPREQGFVNEEWKYTNVAPIARTAFQLTLADASEGLTADHLEPFTFGQSGWPRLVFVNGNYAENLSRNVNLPAGVQAGSLAVALVSNAEGVQAHLARHAEYQKRAFTALNTAFIHDGGFVYIPAGKVVEEPIHVIYLTIPDETPIVSHPRTLIITEQGSLARIVESYVGLAEGTYFSNAVSEIVVGQGAVVDHYRIQQETTKAYHISTTQIYQAGQSNFSSFNLAMGAALARNDVNTMLAGEGVESCLNGLYLVTGSQHVDNHTRIDHVKPNCNSYEDYKGILDGRSRAVFNGKIYVHKDAQKTDAKQLNKNLLLSPGATVNTKPQLEIFADDVKCTHGATIGPLDEEQIFYLITRGMSREVAASLLTYGFARDLIRRLKVEAIREQLDTLFETTIKKLVEARDTV